MNFRIFTTITSILIISLLSGCSTVNPYTGEQQRSNVSSGAIIGAISGAVVGVASSSHHDRGKGALIGAFSGAALGGGAGYYMDIQETKLKQKLQSTGVSVTRDGKNIILNMPDQVTFAVNKTELSQPAENVLDSVALVAKEYKNTKLNIFGFTDNTGQANYNQRLSEIRANKVAFYLINLGIDVKRISYKGMGEKSPVASNSNSQGRKQNRRVEIVLSPM